MTIDDVTTSEAIDNDAVRSQRLVCGLIFLGFETRKNYELDLCIDFGTYTRRKFSTDSETITYPYLNLMHCRKQRVS